MLVAQWLVNCVSETNTRKLAGWISGLISSSAPSTCNFSRYYFLWMVPSAANVIARNVKILNAINFSELAYHIRTESEERAKVFPQSEVEVLCFIPCNLCRVVWKTCAFIDGCIYTVWQSSLGAIGSQGSFSAVEKGLAAVISIQKGTHRRRGHGGDWTSQPQARPLTLLWLILTLDSREALSTLADCTCSTRLHLTVQSNSLLLCMLM